MNVDVDVEARDCDALGQYLLARAETNRERRVRYVVRRSIVVLVFISVAIAMFHDRGGVSRAVLMVGGYIVLMGAYVAFLHYRTRVKARQLVAQVVAEEKEKPLRTRHYAITEQGVSLRENGESALASWDSIADIVQTEEHIFVFGEREFPGVIPKRAFETDAEALQFFKLAREYWIHRARI